MKRKIFGFLGSAALLLNLTLLSIHTAPAVAAAQPDASASILFDFENYSSSEALAREWEAFNSTEAEDGSLQGSVGSLDASGENSCGGSGKSFKLSYDHGKTYERWGALMGYNPHITLAGTGFTFWAKSDQAITLRVEMYDGDYIKVHKDVELIVGENIVTIPYTAFEPYAENAGHTANMAGIDQLRFAVMTQTAGTLWIDSIGCVGVLDPTHRTHPDTTDVLFDFEGYADSGALAAQWKAFNSTEAEDGSLQGSVGSLDASGANSCGGSGKSFKLSYDHGKTYERWGALMGYDPHITLTGTGFTFWAKSDRAITLRVEMYDGDYIKVHKDVELIAGENIVTIPYTAFEPYAENAEHTANMAGIDQLRFAVMTQTAGTLWIDSVGCAEAKSGGQTGPQTHPDTSKIIFDFENFRSTESMQKVWMIYFNGPDGQGASTRLNTDAANSYGGSGNSLAMTYDMSKTAGETPCLAYNPDTEIAGDALAFWVKTDRSASLRVQVLDHGWKSVHADVRVFPGENIVEIPWDSFAPYADNADYVPDMRSFRQLRFFLMQGDAGELYVDSIAFTNCAEDQGPENPSKDPILNPPVSYTDWVDGENVPFEDFESYSGNEDLNYQLTWKTDSDNATAVLDTQTKHGGAQALRMDFDYTKKNGWSLLLGYAQDTQMNIGDGVRFWLKADDEFLLYAGVRINDETYNVTFRTSKEWTEYKIPLRAFFKGQDVRDTLQISAGKELFFSFLSFSIDSGTGGKSGFGGKGTIWVDDISFVDFHPDEEEEKQDFRGTAEGVTIVAPAGTLPDEAGVTVENIRYKPDELAALLESAGIGGQVLGYKSVTVFTKDGTPSNIQRGQASLFFDLPENVKPADVKIYKVYVDGSVEECPVSDDNGKAAIRVFKLGDFLILRTDGAADPQPQPPVSSEAQNPGTGAAWPAAALGLAIMAGGLACLSKKRGTR